MYAFDFRSGTWAGTVRPRTWYQFLLLMLASLALVGGLAVLSLVL